MMMMSRRTNLNTVRKSFSWSSIWTHTNEPEYMQAIWLDHKINEYLIGIFYALKMPTSNYIISRFSNSFVSIEVDIYVSNSDRISNLLSSKKLLLFFLSFSKNILSSKNYYAYLLFLLIRYNRYAVQRIKYYFYIFFDSFFDYTNTKCSLLWYSPIFKSHIFSALNRGYVSSIVIKNYFILRRNVCFTNNLLFLRKKIYFHSIYTRLYDFA